MTDMQVIELLQDLRKDGRTLPELRIKVRPSNGREMVQVSLADQDLIETVEIEALLLTKAPETLEYEIRRLVDRRKAIWAKP